MRFVEDLAGLLKSLAARLREVFREIGLHPADPAVTARQARAGALLHELPQIFTRLDHVEKDGERAQFHGGRPHAREVVRHPRDLGHDDAHVMAALRHRDPEELLHGHAVAHVVDQRRDVVQPVGVRDDAVVIDHFRHLLEVTNQEVMYLFLIDLLFLLHLYDKYHLYWYYQGW